MTMTHPNSINNNEDPAPTPLSVDFDLGKNSIRHYEITRDDLMESWYNSADQRAFIRDTVESVRVFRNTLAGNNVVFLEEPREQHCIRGIERIISTAIVNRVFAIKMRVTNSVLEEQRRQEMSGHFDPGHIAAAPRSYSSWSEHMARKLAVECGRLDLD